jgi:mono/diheme cytochrome c family protein
MWRRWITVLLFLVLPGDLLAEPQLEKFFAQNCVKCHGPEKQKGKVRLDRPADVLFADGELLETVASMLESGDMPPEKAPQPKAEARAKALQLLQKHILTQRPVNPLKRLTRAEYTNTLRDLFGVEFDLTGLLPPDHVEHGFDKFGEAHLMSPHQVMAYLKTARFVAERLFPDTKPETRNWDFNASHFHGSENFAVGGGGDYRDGDGFILTGFRPYRSNIHFSTKPDVYDRFKIPTFGRYRLDVQVESVDSNEAEIIGINLGDGRYPTSIRSVHRIPMPHRSKSFTTELTLKVGDQLAFTFDSARIPGNGNPRKYKGSKIRFTSVKVTGPLIEEWPTSAMQAILPKPDMKPGELVDHLALLLTQRPLSAEDRPAFVEIAEKQRASGASAAATARSVLIALLTSPHFVYKAESPELTSVELAHRLSYFLWNSVPDAKLLAFAKSGGLGKDPSAQVERMLKDAKAGRFIDDFTRQWLQRDKVDNFGPDVRVFKNVRRMTVDSMGREGRELFRHLLEKGLSMEHFIDSDFIMANDRLARFYKLPKVEGDAFVPVKLPTKSERGGLVAQAGFLKLTSTDFATSPIHRGSWILKNLYNERIEPPADILINEPDIRGTTTIREAILKHQELESCARCHSKIDPLGFALEYYDPVGRKRPEYRHVQIVNKLVERGGRQQLLQILKTTKAPIESAMKLPDGREVRDLPTLKAALMADKEPILKGIIGKLISYAHGRDVTRADRPYIDAVFQAAQKQNHSLRATIHAIVAHPEFGRK